MVHCVAFGCNNKKKKGDWLHFFSFPRDEALRKSWIVKMKREGYVWKETHKLCSEHFASDCYERDPKFMKEYGYFNALPRLKQDAVPSIFAFPSSSSTSTIVHTNFTTPTVRGGYMKRRRIEAIDDCFKQYTEENEQVNMVNDVQHAVDMVSDVETDIHTPLTVTSQSTANKKIQVRPDVKTKGTGTSVQSTNRSQYSQTYSNKVDASTQYSPPIEVCDAYCQTESTDNPESDYIDSSCGSITFNDNNNNDPDYVPYILSNKSEEIESEEIRDHVYINNVAPNEEHKYLVFQSCLLELFQTCRELSCFCDIIQKKLTVIGTMVEVVVKCKVGHEWCWYSQPSHRGMPWGNLLTGAAILVSGNGYNKIAAFLNILKVPFISQSTFTKTQRSYFIPVIINHWTNCKQAITDSLQEEEIVLGGDGRCDSPGYNAKYGTYTVMDLERNKILDVQIVQSNEVGGSVRMELEGLKRALSRLQEAGVNVVRVVTDRHVQVKKYMREDHPGIKHDFDVWHVANSIDKKLTAASKKKTGEEIKPWMASIKNHLYWVATSSGDDGAMKRAKWLSVLNHISDQHTGHSDIFPACVHGEIEPRQWIRKGSIPYKLLAPIIDNNYLLKDVEKLSSAHQTYGLEVFHSVMLMFAPKNTHYFYWSMVARSYLAALHYNENSDNKQAQTLDSTPRFAPVYPKKYKGEAMVVKPVKEKPTYHYAEQIMECVVSRRVHFPSYRLANNDASDLLIGEPAYLTSAFAKVDKEQLIVNRMTRFPNIH